MAQGSTVYKATINLSNLDKQFYDTMSVTVARHPSETEKRLILRVLAYCMFSGGTHLSFGRGLSTEGEPALWDVDDTGHIALWLELGVPDVKAIRKAAGKSDQVVILSYDQAKIEPWWESHKADFNKIEKLSVLWIADDVAESLSHLVTRNLKMAVTIQDEVMWIDSDQGNIEWTYQWLKRAQEV